MKTPSEHDVEIMHKMQEKLWELIIQSPCIPEHRVLH